MIEIFTYTSNCKSLWDDFVRRSKKGTFLFYRDYMEYHADRFLDSSLLFFKDDDLVAVMSANTAQNIDYSHDGLTLGASYRSKHETVVMLQLFGKLITSLKAQGIKKVVYKAIPYIYHKNPS